MYEHWIWLLGGCGAYISWRGGFDFDWHVVVFSIILTYVVQSVLYISHLYISHLNNSHSSVEQRESMHTSGERAESASLCEKKHSII